LDQDYKKNFTSFENLKRTYHLILDELRKIKRERPDITIAEHDKLKKEIAEKGNTIFHLTQENSDINQSLVNQQAEITDLTTNLTDITNQRNLLQTEKNNLQVELQNKENELNSQKKDLELKVKEITTLKTQLQAKNSENKKLETKNNTFQIELESREKEIIQEINNSLNLNLSEPTLSFIITHLKALITPSPAFSDDICVRDLEIIKGIDLLEMEKFFGIQLSEKEKQQFQSTTHYQGLVIFRHYLLKQHLAQTAIATQLPTLDKQLSKKENILSVLLIVSLLIIFLQFIFMKKRTKRKFLANIK
jgi:predicted nuclease with TOPRIM domain